MGAQAHPSTWTNLCLQCHTTAPSCGEFTSVLMRMPCEILCHMCRCVLSPGYTNIWNVKPPCCSHHPRTLCCHLRPKPPHRTPPFFGCVQQRAFIANTITIFFTIVSTINVILSLQYAHNHHQQGHYYTNITNTSSASLPPSSPTPLPPPLRVATTRLPTLSCGIWNWCPSVPTTMPRTSSRRSV